MNKQKLIQLVTDELMNSNIDDVKIIDYIMAFKHLRLLETKHYYEYTDRVKNSTDLIKYACDLFSVDEVDLLSNNRGGELVKVRKAISYLLYNEGIYSLKQIGEIIGGKDHASILHYKKCFDQAKDIGDETVFSHYNKLKQSLEKDGERRN